MRDEIKPILQPGIFRPKPNFFSPELASLQPNFFSPITSRHPIRIARSFFKVVAIGEFDQIPDLVPGDVAFFATN